MDLVQAMRIFSRVAETESFTRAGEQLALSVPVVTRSIAALESHLNVRLLNRTTRRVSMTEAGQIYLEGCRSLLQQLDEVEASVAKASQQMAGMLRIAASNSFALLRLGPVLAAYQARFPKVELNLTLVDHPIDLVQEGFDAAILSTEMVSSETLVMRRLRSIASLVVASPAYLSRAGTPLEPEHLSAHAFLAAESFGRTFSFERGDAQQRVSLNPTFTVNSILMLHRAALSGMGLTMLPSSLVEADLASGALVRLVPAWQVREAEVSVALAYPSRRFVSPKLRSFIDHVIEAFA